MDRLLKGPHEVKRAEFVCAPCASTTNHHAVTRAMNRHAASSLAGLNTSGLIAFWNHISSFSPYYACQPKSCRLAERGGARRPRARD